jgi:hypothetical protein
VVQDEAGRKGCRGCGVTESQNKETKFGCKPKWKGGENMAGLIALIAIIFSIINIINMFRD